MIVSESAKVLVKMSEFGEKKIEGLWKEKWYRNDKNKILI